MNARLAMTEVTVIIPIHNSEKYLEECIESALSQSFRNLEILCIDGGSEDRSREMIKNFQKMDSRIIPIYDRNTSYGHKINVGIDRARGKYVAILESDDRMEPDMIETLHEAAETHGADVVDGDYYELLSYDGRELRSGVRKRGNMEDYGHLIDNAKEPDISTAGIWTGLYKKSFLLEQNIRLNESPGASYQDLSFLFLTSLLAGRVYHVRKPIYQYRVDNGGSSVKDESKIFEIAGECEFLRNDLFNRGIREKRKWNLYYIRKYDAFYWNYCRLSKKAGETFLEKYEEELRDDIKKGAIDREIFRSSLYERAFLLLDDRETFIEKAAQVSVRPFLERACGSMEKIGGREVVLFGAGSYGTRLMDVFIRNGICIKGVCDNARARQGKVLGGLEIKPVKQAVTKFPRAVYVITSCKYRKEMLEQLLEEGIKKEKIIIF